MSGRKGIKAFAKKIVPSKCRSAIKSSHIRARANKQLSKISGRKVINQRIKVAFLAQMSEIWDKQAPVFDVMLNDNRFDLKLVVVPKYNKENNEAEGYGDVLDFFENRYGKELIIKAYETNWVDLKDYSFDYVFFQRCWENYLPPIYHTKNIIKFAKTCYIPYGIGGIRYDQSFYDKSFFAYLYAHFCSSQEQVEMQRKNKYKHNLFLGIPVLDRKLSLIKEYDSNMNKQVLWTPRWTEDDYYGGTTFFKYKDQILTIKENIPEVDLVLRPHPLTFQNAVRVGRMTESEVADYKNRVDELGIRFDDNKEIGDTFNHTGILITDFSSIILEYFLSGKPIIYCSNIDISLSEVYRKISKGFYLVNSWEELKVRVEKLLKGEDELKELRQAIIEELKSQFIGSTERIVDFILRDAWNDGNRIEG